MEMTMRRIAIALALVALTGCLPDKPKWAGTVYDTLHGQTLELPPRDTKTDCEAQWVTSEMFLSGRYNWLGCKEV
jgi:hypothetical protein